MASLVLYITALSLCNSGKRMVGSLHNVYLKIITILIMLRSVYTTVQNDRQNNRVIYHCYFKYRH